MLETITDLFWQGCLVLLLIAFACLIVSVIVTIISTTIDSIQRNKIKNETLKAMINELDKLQKK